MTLPSFWGPFGVSVMTVEGVETVERHDVKKKIEKGRVLVKQDSVILQPQT